MLQHEVQGRKEGFLRGNKAYYRGGTFLVWKLAENETIGLTHPFYHDLRSRGTGVATCPDSCPKGIDVGTGNDYSGWEWSRFTKAAYGTVIDPRNGTRYVYPTPTRMDWRPDRMVIDYDLGGGLTLHEEKFISANDAVNTIITSSIPVDIEFEGQSFVAAENEFISSNATCSFDSMTNAIHIIQGGTVKTEVYQNPNIYVNGTLMFVDRRLDFKYILV